MIILQTGTNIKLMVGIKRRIRHRVKHVVVRRNTKSTGGRRKEPRKNVKIRKRPKKLRTNSQMETGT